MKIGILQTGRAGDAMQATEGDYPEMFARLLEGYDFEFTTFPVLDHVFPDSPTQCEGWLITGSRHGVYEEHDWIPPLLSFIREIYAAKRPLIGVCFGHQIIAKALGGQVEKFSGGWVVGRSQYVNSDREKAPLTLLAWHQDQVTEIGPDAEVLYQNEACKYAALSYGNSVFTIQPHPEFSPKAIGHLIDSHGQKVPQESLKSADESRHLPVDQAIMAKRFADHFLSAR